MPLPDSWLELYTAILASQLVRYGLLAGGAFAVFYGLWRRHFVRHRIREAMPKASDYRREVLYSLLTLAIFAGVGVGVVMAGRAGYTQMYFELSDYSWGWLVLSVLLTIVLHDTYFYWTHRLMHWRAIYRYVHRVHHQSTNPSPWAAFAFHPLEAVIEAGILPLAVLLYPLHPVAVGIFLLYMTGMNVLGHLGYELYPRGFVTHPLGRWHNTSTHHALHHHHFTGNYGLYFNWWDRWMGTNQARYVATYEQVTARRDAGAVTSLDPPAEAKRPAQVY